MENRRELTYDVCKFKCGYSGRYSMVASHELVCPCSISVCEHGCGYTGTCEQVEAHELSCPVCPAVCEYDCGYSGTYSEVEAHELCCPMSRAVCEYDCGYSGTYSEVEVHERCCPMDAAKAARESLPSTVPPEGLALGPVSSLGVTDLPPSLRKSHGQMSDVKRLSGQSDSSILDVCVGRQSGGDNFSQQLSRRVSQEADGISYRDDFDDQQFGDSGSCSSNVGPNCPLDVQVEPHYLARGQVQPQAQGEIQRHSHSQEHLQVQAHAQAQAAGDVRAQREAQEQAREQANIQTTGVQRDAPQQAQKKAPQKKKKKEEDAEQPRAGKGTGEDT